ncbi:butyrophilin subfamily 3 member A2-like [Nothobranchius furzeri]
MGHQPEKSSLNLQTGTAVVFQILLLIHTCTGQSEDLDPSQSIRAMVGDDITLPCSLKPPKDASQTTVEWGRLDLTPRFVHVWYEGQELLVDQNRAYKGRASVSAGQLKHGDASLRISDVRLTDNGRYRCYVPKAQTENYVDLLVGSVSSPEIRLAGLDEGSSGVMLDCSSGTWWPEPELLWLDAEGHVLSAGPTETTRGSDGLLAVSSRVTVQKSPNNTITCRIHQKDLKQSRETHVHVPDDFFVVRSSCSVSISFSVLFCCLFLVSASVLVWRQRHLSKKKETIKTIEEERELMRVEQKLQDDDLKSRIRELEKKLTIQMAEAKNDADEFNKKIKDFQEETEKETKQNKNKEIKTGSGLTLKEIVREHNAKLGERKKGYDKILLDIQKMIRENKENQNQVECKEEKKENEQEEMKK